MTIEDVLIFRHAAQYVVFARSNNCKLISAKLDINSNMIVNYACNSILRLLVPFDLVEIEEEEAFNHEVLF